RARPCARRTRRRSRPPAADALPSPPPGTSLLPTSEPCPDHTTTQEAPPTGPAGANRERAAHPSWLQCHLTEQEQGPTATPHSRRSAVPGPRTRTNTEQQAVHRST